LPKPSYAAHRNAPPFSPSQVSNVESSSTVESILVEYRQLRTEARRPRRQGDIPIESRRLTATEWNRIDAENANSNSRRGLAVITRIATVQQRIPSWRRFSIASNYTSKIRLQPSLELNASDHVVKVPLEQIFSSNLAFSEVDFDRYTSMPRKVLFLNLNVSSPHRILDYAADSLGAIRSLSGRIGGIEPPPLAWKARALPLCNIRGLLA
jgi:hypothetical protein